MGFLDLIKTLFSLLASIFGIVDKTTPTIEQKTEEEIDKKYDEKAQWWLDSNKPRDTDKS